MARCKKCAASVAKKEAPAKKATATKKVVATKKAPVAKKPAATKETVDVAVLKAENKALKAQVKSLERLQRSRKRWHKFFAMVVRYNVGRLFL